MLNTAMLPEMVPPSARDVPLTRLDNKKMDSSCDITYTDKSNPYARLPTFQPFPDDVPAPFASRQRWKSKGCEGDVWLSHEGQASVLWGHYLPGQSSTGKVPPTGSAHEEKELLVKFKMRFGVPPDWGFTERHPANASSFRARIRLPGSEEIRGEWLCDKVKAQCSAMQHALER